MIGNAEWSSGGSGWPSSPPSKAWTASLQIIAQQDDGSGTGACEYIERRENVIALGNSGTGKTHIALGLGLAACQKGLTVGFITAAALVHELIEARDEKRLLRFQKQLAKYKLLIIDELGFVPLSKTGAELLFEVFSQRYEGGSTLVSTRSMRGPRCSRAPTGALLDRPHTTFISWR